MSKVSAESNSPGWIGGLDLRGVSVNVVSRSYVSIFLSNIPVWMGRDVSNHTFKPEGMKSGR